MNADQLEQLVRECLANFYRRRVSALDGLNLRDLLRRKNPYLFRAAAIATASEMIERLLAAHISSSDEAVFGEEFFEPICKAVSGAQAAGVPGVDFTIETQESFQAITLKSGPNAFNSSQVSKQNEQFDALQRSLQATVRRVRKAFIPIMGCGYGRVDSQPTRARRYAKLAGQSFWQRITGDAHFYLKLVRLMRDDPDKHRESFDQSWARAVNRFARDFLQQFCDPAGNILWEDLVQFNSGTNRPRHAQPRTG